MKPLNVITLFSGYDSQALALNRLGIPYDLVAWAEIDKHACTAHDALFPQFKGRNVGDVSRVDWAEWHRRHPQPIDLLTYSSPCQDFSSAGLQRGGEEGSGTRSGLLWETERAVSELRPRHLVFENVGGLVSDKFIDLFQRWQVRLNGYGYTNFAQLMNAKDYGVPQNRLRIFMVSILDCPRAYYFPQPFRLERRLKDVLEKSVPETCYLSQERVDGLVLSTEKEKDAGRGFAFAAKTVDSDCENTVSTNAGGRKTDNFVREPKILEPVVIEDFYQDRPIRVYEGEAPTLRSDRAGLKVAEPIIFSKVAGFGTPGVFHDTAPSLTTNSYDCNNVLAEPIVLGWVRDAKGNVVSRPEVDVATCVTAGKRDNTQNYVLEQVIEEVRKAFTNLGILMYKGNPYFVRKLSTRELYRLMDVDEADIDTLLAAPIPRTQHAKLAGNSIVVACLYYIFRNLFVDTEPAAGTQTQLF